MKQSTKKTSPWAWIPTLYFAQGLPYVAVMTISVIMYKRLGISNTDIALYTGWLYLPWVIKSGSGNRWSVCELGCLLVMLLCLPLCL